MDTFVTFINNVGFPIAVCVYMAYRDEKLTGIINDLSITLKGIEKTLDNKEE